MSSTHDNALLLTGGGARGAYQAGVLKGISSFYRGSMPFPILVGTSAGAINCSYLAASVNQLSFQESSNHLAHMWSELQSSNIFSTNPMSMVSNGGKWFRLLAGGGITGDSHNMSLLNSKRLANFLGGIIKFSEISKSIESKKVRALGITTLCYKDSKTRTFYQSLEEIEPWSRKLRDGVPERISLSHVLASASIPVIFPSHKIHGEFYGDGSVRNMAPISPAIKLGAKKVLIINVKAKRTEREISPLGPSLAQILGTMLNGLMLDNLSADIEKVKAFNEIIELTHKEGPHSQVDILKISPSRNISNIAVEEFKDLPGSVRYFMKGLGNPKESSELLSYVLFESNFTSRLVKLGYDDALEHKEKILKFIG